MYLTSDKDIADLLKRTKTIALIGASPKAHRPSYGVMRFLLKQGYDVYPVNPGQAGKELQGRLVHATLNDIPVPIDLVDVFRNASHLPQVVDETIAVKAKALWTQLDVINEVETDRASEAGLDVVVNKCPAIEIPRLTKLGFF